jgi:endonuclease/exonuclease/phosphatase family metal-dependent hydrolase
MRIVTWNVLHRIHAENWREAVPDRFPDEAARNARITARVRAFVDDDTVVCLQEVSGDQLASVRAALPADRVHAFQLPRVPRPKSGASPLVDATEHLVIVAPRGRWIDARVSADDPGKGVIVVDVDVGVDGATRVVRVANTHLTFGDRRTAQLAMIAQLVDGAALAVVCGDCNCGVDDVVAALPGFRAAPFAADALPTRPRAEGYDGKPKAIDHIVVRGVDVGAAVVVDVDGESDHNVVVAHVGGVAGG